MSEDPTEQAQEDIHHHATHAAHAGHADHSEDTDHGRSNRWITAAALTAALLAALSAVGGEQASSHQTESTHQRIEWSDKWAQYQSKSIKNYVLSTQGEVLKALKSDVPPGIPKKLADNEAEMKSLSDEARALDAASNAHMNTHETFEFATTLFHIAIAIVAIAVVAKRKEFWYISIVGGVIGLYFFIAAFLHAPAAAHEAAHESAPLTATHTHDSNHTPSENAAPDSAPHPAH